MDKFRHKSIRDPLYGFVGLSETETELVDTPIFRRLHSIKQLSHAFLVYPSAIHTRFEHSLGCAHLAGRMCDQLGIGGREKEDVRIAALLHDIGHGPFSHLFEDAVRRCNPDLGSPHERISEIMILEDPDIGRILGGARQRIVDLLKKKRPTTASDIVSSSLDADKLDYLLRDSFHIGVSYGRFDPDRIMHTLRANKQDTALCVDVKGKDALENYRLGRHLLHVQVYHHHARLIADRMFLQALYAALDGGVIAKADLRIGPGDNSRFLEFYGALDDNSVYDLVIRHPDAGLAGEILRDVRRRRLLKRACDFTIPDLMEHADVRRRLIRMEQSELDDMSARVAEQTGTPTRRVVFHKSAVSIQLYHKNPLMIVRRGKVISLSDYSPFRSADSVIRYIVYGPSDADTRKKIAAKIAGELGIDESVISYLE